ncbi:MAG: hypothetical protein F4100_02385 [Rhodothermaceae bacterium]|nr:hypothetical protein [Rhodothermaceae bacterium]MYE61977.1 hypothetical protein [Rhodothermaceae bacterium]MYJ19582.1 hypothetical protein [Rhodothermaceae bacterium]
MAKHNQKQVIARLAAKIKGSVSTGELIETKLETSERIIARITDGIYREPWAAFRELVINAYDADATRVIVETGAPDFKQVIIRDNGNGMSPNTVAFMLKSIGGSSKRTIAGAEYNTVSPESLDKSPGGRPLIGKIGIGLFSVAQLTQHFQIITKAADEDIRTSATIKLETYDEEPLTNYDEQDYVAGGVSVLCERVKESDIETHGTSIVLYALRPEIRRQLQSQERWELLDPMSGPDGKPVRDTPVFHIGVLPDQIQGVLEGKGANLPWGEEDNETGKFKKLVEAVSNLSGRSRVPDSLEHFDEYLKMMWKLSLALPLKYVDHHPFDLKGASKILFYKESVDQRSAIEIELEENETIGDKLNLTAGDNTTGTPFKVLVDGVELRRPISLLSELRRKSRVPSPMFLVGRVEKAFQKKDLKRAGGQLSFQAYLYWNSKIIPKETVGVLVRVRDASGTLFDSKFLNYQISEQTRLKQITAEIFVSNGLDSAINIDRESLNYSHPHFLYIQKWLHRALRLLINKNKGLSAENLKEERREKEKARDKGIIVAAKDIWWKRRGVDADPPAVDISEKALIPEVGGIELEWEEEKQEEIPLDNTKASALAIVLEAYGVLSHLGSTERTELIRGILKVLNDPS